MLSRLHTHQHTTSHTCTHIPTHTQKLWFRVINMKLLESKENLNKYLHLLTNNFLTYTFNVLRQKDCKNQGIGEFAVKLQFLIMSATAPYISPTRVLRRELGKDNKRHANGERPGGLSPAQGTVGNPEGSRNGLSQGVVHQWVILYPVVIPEHTFKYTGCTGCIYIFRNIIGTNIYIYVCYNE